MVSTSSPFTGFVPARGQASFSGLPRHLDRFQRAASCGFFCRRAIILAALTSLASASIAPERPSLAVDLARLSLEDLGQIKVTSVSRKSESLSGAAAAVYVITQEDLRRSGVTSLPEALRMAPGLQVARANARQWAISARGFNDTFANKLLVLMDATEMDFKIFVDPATLLQGLPLPALVSVEGNPNIGSEELVAYEIGHRIKPRRWKRGWLGSQPRIAHSPSWAATCSIRTIGSFRRAS